MYNVKITYEYDGSRYYGFQKQKSDITIQGEIEKFLAIICKEKINLISAGRTDRGVHAKFQVSNFYTKIKIDIKKWLYIFERGLPKDIKIKEVSYVDLEFNSRFDAKYREYDYYITWNRNPFKANYLCFIQNEIDCNQFYDILKVLKGKHNFKNFMLSDDKKVNTYREILKIKVSKINKNTIKVTIRANSFLKSQIRIIIGTAIDIYFGKTDRNRIIDMINYPEKTFKKQLAQPEGLYLTKVKY